MTNMASYLEAGGTLLTLIAGVVVFFFKLGVRVAVLERIEKEQDKRIDGLEENLVPRTEQDARDRDLERRLERLEQNQ